MKKLFLLSMFAFIFSVTLLAQNVPNGGFENWTAGAPDNWATSNAPPVIANVTRSSTAHSGSYSIRGDVVNLGGTAYPAIIQSGPEGTGFAISQRYATVSGYYQLTSVSGDVFGVNCILYNGADAIASAPALFNAASSWTQFSVNFAYLGSGTPDNAILQFLTATTSGTLHVGSYFLLDDLNLSGTAPTSVNDKNTIPAKFSLDQNYPNPFNPSTKIQYNLPENSFVSLKVYNAIGQEVAALVNGVVPAGTHEVLFDASPLNSGVYFYTLKSGNNFVQTRKMILLK
jgi:hypothetical protein